MWRLGQVRDTILGTGISNETLLNAVKYQGYIFTAFTVFELLRKTQQKERGGGGVKLPSTQIRVTLFIANPFKHDTHVNTEANTFLIVFYSESSIISLNLFS